MRILDEQRDCSVARVTILLTRVEAEELRDSLAALLSNGIGHHVHSASVDFQKEITLALYDDNNIHAFNDRCQRLIREDR
jgi:hypothetical protein